MQDSFKLIEERLFPYMIDVFNKKNFAEYNKNFGFLLDMFLLGKEKNKTPKNSKLLKLIENKLYEAIKLPIQNGDLEFSRNLIETFIDTYPIEYSSTHPFQGFNFKFREIIINFIHKDLANLQSYFSYKSEFLKLYKNMTLKYLENLKQDKNFKSDTLIHIYTYFYNQTIKLGIDRNLKEEIIDLILPQPYNKIHFIVNNNKNSKEIISYYENLILEISHYVTYNLDKEGFRVLLKKFNSFYLKELKQNLLLKIITKLGIYIYYLYLESEDLFNKKRKILLKEMINDSILISENKEISFSKLLNKTIQDNIENFISLKKEFFNIFDKDIFYWELYYEGEAKRVQLPTRAEEFYKYFLIIHYSLLWKESTKKTLLNNFTFNEIWYLLENFFDIENYSLKEPYLRNFNQLLDLFSITLNEEKTKENISIFINDLGYYYKEQILKNLKSFYDKNGNFKREIEDKLNIIKSQVSEDIRKLFSEDIYHKIGKKNNSQENHERYNLSYQISLPIDMIFEISGKELTGNALYNFYLQNLKNIFKNNFSTYKIDPYKPNQIELQEIKEKLKILKEKCGINTAILSNSLKSILLFKPHNNIFSEFFKEFEIFTNKYYQDFTLFLNKDEFYLSTKIDVKIQKPTEKDISKCINSNEDKIKLLRRFLNAEELKTYCKLSMIYILVDIQLNIYTQKFNDKNCGVILIER